MDIVTTNADTTAWLLDLGTASDTEESIVKLDDIDNIMLSGYNFILLRPQLYVLCKHTASM